LLSNIIVSDDWVLLEKVDKFCYLGDMINADGGLI